MIFRALNKVGIPSDIAYLLGGASIIASIVAWAVRSDDDQGHAERLGIFVGLWAPTFMIVGNGLKTVEEGTGSNPGEVLAGRARQASERVGQLVAS